MRSRVRKWSTYGVEYIPTHRISIGHFPQKSPISSGSSVEISSSGVEYIWSGVHTYTSNSIILSNSNSTLQGMLVMKGVKFGQDGAHFGVC